jgi:hypothetical protein
LVTLFNLMLLAVFGVNGPLIPLAVATGSSAQIASQSTSQIPSAAPTNPAPPNQFAPTLIVAEAGSEQDSVPASKFLSSDLLGVAVLNLNPQLWEAANQFNPFKMNVLDAFTRLNQLPEGMTFGQDIQPWLGDRVVFAVAATPDQKDFSLTILMPITDNTKYEAFVAKTITKHKQKPSDSLYKGIRILEWESKDAVGVTALKCSKSFAKIQPNIQLNSQYHLLFNLLATKSNIKCGGNVNDKDDGYGGFPSFLLLDIFGFSGNGAVLATLPNGYLAVSGSREPIEKLIDAQENLVPLSQNLFWQRTVKNPIWERSLLAGYADNKRLLKMLENQFKPSAKKHGTETETVNPFGFGEEEFLNELRRSAEEYTSFDFYAWTSPQGLHSLSSTYYTKPRSIQPVIGKSDQILSLLPANAYVSVSSQNFKQQWQWLNIESKSYPSLSFLINIMKETLAPTFDIEKDLVPWLDGEYAMILFPSDRGLFKNFGFDLALGTMMQTSNPTAARAAIARVEQKLLTIADGAFTVSKREVGGITVTSWEVNDYENKAASQSVLAYGWKDQKTLVVASGIAPLSTLIVTPKTSLAQSEMFKTAISNMPKPNFGYFYMDAKSLVRFGLIGFLSFGDTSTEPTVPPDIKKLLDSLGGMVTVYSQTPDRLQSDVFLGLKPIEK